MQIFVPKSDFSKIDSTVDYEKYWDHRVDATTMKMKARHRIFLDWIPEGSKVLILGCGVTSFPKQLKDKGCDVLATDISETVLGKVKKLGVSTKKLDLTKPIILSKTYDYVIASEVLEHLANPEEVVRQVSPHTKHFLITIPNIAYYPNRLTLLLKGTFPKQWTFHPSEHLRYWSHTDMIAWLEANKCTVEKSYASNGLDPLMNIFPNIFGHQICYLAKVKD